MTLPSNDFVCLLFEIPFSRWRDEYRLVLVNSKPKPDITLLSADKKHVLWFFFGSMYPGLNCSLEYDSAFGFLTHLNSEELKVLLNDESKLEEMAKDQKQYRDLEKEKEMLLASNQSLAEYNLSLQPKFELSKQELLDKTDVCDHLLQSLESKAALLGEKSGRSVLDSKLSSLQLVTSELEESSEDFADNFLAGECDLEEFLDKFLSRRKQMHLEKVKADKMADMLKQYQMGF